MSVARRASRIVATAAVGGAAVGGGGLGMLWAQAMLARHRVGDPRGEPFEVDGTYGVWADAGRAARTPPYRLLVVGDSGAAGLGADSPDDTVAVVIARGLALAAGRPVELVNAAVVGAQTSALAAQLEGYLETHPQPDVVMIMVGANDVTHGVRPQVSVRQLREVVGGLVEAGSQVVVACCPDLGTVEPLPNPLRHLGRRLSRTLAAAQELVTTEAGGHPVELGSLLGPEFAARPGEYFSEDRFHPSSVGYRRCAEMILPVVCEALGVPGPAPAPAPAPAPELASPADAG
jgi:lysophospholipase L1-like esterase